MVIEYCSVMRKGCMLVDDKHQFHNMHAEGVARYMEQFNFSLRNIIGGIVALGGVLVVAFLQDIFHFSTYLALAICLVLAIIFCQIMVGNSH